MNYARIVNAQAVEICASNPVDLFHADLAAQFEAVPDDVEAGWILDVDGWSPSTTALANPATPPPAPAVIVSPVEFKLLFTAPERVAIKFARTDDPIVDDFFDLIEDPRLSGVNLGLQSTQDALDYLISKSLIAPARKAEILSGVVQ